MLFEHKVFTTHQLVELAWPTIRAANHRLRDLYCWRVVDRFQPFVSSGTAPMHYVLDIAGAVALAYEDGLDPKDLGYRHEAAIGIAHSLRLAHTIGVNGFFTALVARSRPPTSTGQLTAWWSELRCARHWGDIVRPDAYGRWREGDDEVEFFLEFDFGTESLGRLAGKLPGYEKLAAATGIATPVLVWLPTTRRETSGRRALATALAALDRPSLVPVATSAADLSPDTSHDSPANARWLPVSGPDPRHPGRLCLAHLARLWPYLSAPQPPPSQTPVTDAMVRAELAPPFPLPPPQPIYRIRR